MRKLLRVVETEVIRRSKAVDTRWASQRLDRSEFSGLVTLVLGVLEALDQFLCASPFSGDAAAVSRLHGVVFGPVDGAKDNEVDQVNRILVGKAADGRAG